MKYLKLILILFYFSNINAFPEVNEYRTYITFQDSIVKKLLSENYKAYKVIKIIDGDTIDILVDNQIIRVRLSHINCPEKGKPYWKRAKQFVSESCFGAYVRLIIDENSISDRFGRLLAEVILEDGRILNQELVKSGLARHFKKYSISKVYCQLEVDAKNNKVGFWSESFLYQEWIGEKCK